MKKVITVVKGDGIGPEIVEQALKVLDRVAALFGHEFEYQEILAGGCAIDRYGEPLPPESLEKCFCCDGVLLGAVGGPQWDVGPGHLRPERAVLGMRKAMGLFSNARPAYLYPQLAAASPLKPSLAENGIDLIIFRELTGGLYFGRKETFTAEDGLMTAADELVYNEEEIRRIARVAFETARGRRKKVCSVDKANVLETSRLWRQVVEQVAEEYPDVEFRNLLVDNAAMQLVANPAQFDVVVTENMFGDILTDEASMITGSIGMIPSSSLGYGKVGLYEPIHGSAPDIAGKDIANPIGTILAAAMLLEYSCDMKEEAEAVRRAVNNVLDAGYRTADIFPKDAGMAAGLTKVGCRTMGDLITEGVKK
ncbi:MAG: 3-isopropylmalate dehydrogenase [Clostridiales bacterium]|nr:3-isopropylmalate dehydrogenase [Clostridiales bacterium]